MSIRYEPRVYNINDFISWLDQGALELSPKFQRRKVWTRQAQSYLLDTLSRGLPIPPVHLRERTDLETLVTTREVVDGQQRIATVLAFVKGELTMLPSHNAELAGQTFLALRDDFRREFLTYQVPVAMLHGASDADVIEVFSRLNANTLPLNFQEKLNARYFGRFKQTVYKLGADHLEFWRRHAILTERGIARMQEAELTGMLAVMMMHGVQSGRDKIEENYGRFDDEFPGQEVLVAQFQACIAELERVAGDILRGTRWRQKALFYSLFAAVQHILVGIPGVSKQRPPIVENVREAQRKLAVLSNALDDPGVWAGDDSQLEHWYDASTSTTDNKPQRLTRLSFTLNALAGGR
jgi:hypothetical protein